MIDDIRDKIARGQFEFSQHAVDQSIVRRISVQKLREAIAVGEVIVDIRLTHSKKPVAEHRVIRAPGVIEQVAPSAYDAGADAIGRRTRRKLGWRHRDRAAELSV